MTEDGTCNRSIRLPPAAAPDPAVLRAALTGLSPELSCETDSGGIAIHYPFPRVMLAEILDTIEDTLAPDRLPAMTRIRADLAAVMEINERDHRGPRCGWTRYVRDIHAAHYRDETHLRRKPRRRRGADPAAG